MYRIQHKDWKKLEETGRERGRRKGEKFGKMKKS
jgi:hypothetical protein